MPSPDPWRRFVRLYLVAAAVMLAVLYGFVIIVDPWDALPLSPRLPRVPISTNARYSFPALARSERFDSVVLGDSSARLLRPVDLDPGFGARFANLAMNSATAYEQSRMLEVFLRAHPSPRVVIVAMDQAWCGETFQRTTPRPFPDWMYQSNRWPAYREMLTPYAVQEAWNQFAVMVGLKRRRYGLDGYTNFVPPDDTYDRARRDQAFLRWPSLDHRPPPPPGTEAALPALPLLDAMLASLPQGTRKILFFTPYHIDQMGAPGSLTAWRWDACKRAVTTIALRDGAELLDFMVPGAITDARDNFWDPVHYRQSVVARVTEGLIRGASADAERLTP